MPGPGGAPLARAMAILSSELEVELPALDSVAGVDVDRAERRWYVRLEGTERDFITIWFRLGERMLHYECYFLPSPESDAEAAALWPYLLRLNHKLVGVHFALGPDGGVYLLGAVPVETVSPELLDRVVGTVYSVVEQYFRAALRLCRRARTER